MIQTIFTLLLLTFLFSPSVIFAHDVYEQMSRDKMYEVAPYSQEEITYIDHKKTITVCIDPNWMPYEMINEKKGSYVGIAADYHKLLSQITGLEYNILRTKTWFETLEKAKAGECDIVSILNQTTERTNYLNFTGPFIDSPSIFVTRERDKFINGIDDLHGKTLAIVRGYMIDELLKNNHPEIKRLYADNIHEALEMVSTGKAFATAGSLLEMSYNISQLGMLNLKITGDAKYDYELCIGVKKDDPLLLSIMNKALASITKEQRGQIMNNWVSIEYQEHKHYSFLWKITLVIAVILVIIATKNFVTTKYNNKLLSMNKELEKKGLQRRQVNVWIMKDCSCSSQSLRQWVI